MNETELLVPAPVVTAVLCERRDAAPTWIVAVIVFALTTTTLLTVMALPCMVTVAGLVN